MLFRWPCSWLSGEPFDPKEFELREGGWDHEHCDVCWAEVLDGMSYWPNVDPDGGHVDLCETCYARVMALLEYEEDTSMASFIIRLDPRRLGGVCERRLREQMEAFGDLGDILQEMMGDFETQSGSSRSSPFGTSERDSDDEADDDAGPSVLPFRPKGD